MTELTIPELKETSYSILCDVVDFIEQHSLTYFLVCGTALGAIRHNGFIPWDDDIDIAMPRPDYERFLGLYHSDSYYLVDSRSGKKYPYAFAKVCDKRTVLIEHITKPFPLGVYIDVFPIDGIPSSASEQKRYLKLIDWDLRMLSWKRISTEKKLDRVHKIIQFIAKSVLAPFPVSVFVRKLDNDLRRYSYDDCEYVGHLATKAYWGNDLKPKRVFYPPIKHLFEDKEFNVPGNFDEYLKLEYGDYMKLPPTEKQIPHHDFFAYWK